MAFHVACPITCRKICFCELGFPRRLQSENARNEFLEEVAMVERFINDPWLIKGKPNATVQVLVPKVVVATAPPPPTPVPVVDEAAAASSAQMKRAALQKQAAAASVVAEDYAKRFESGDLVTSVEDTAGEDLGQSNSKIMCRLCFRGDNEGSERARKMLPCNSCGKKYHRSCVKSWSQNRDLFHWSSWTCPSCRTCEVCRRTGDPNKFMFCKRCDAAHHCYCQQPPHKNVGHGPYLCPKHTKCHSCGSSVPGNGLSVRWFLGYTCCDACGRLFVKNNYCPVCLKVYRDSESTPMVCCDICEKWVHCPCDGISEAKYMQFQVDGNLQYVCPTCRGECRQVKTMEEAVQELWRRRDEADKDLIAGLRAAAGLPTQEEIFDISPFSDDEEGASVVKNEYVRSLKFSLKGVGDNSPRKNKEYGKKSSSKKSGKKKGNVASSISKKGDGSTFGYTASGYNEEMQLPSEFDTVSPIAGSLTEGFCSVNEAGVSKHKYVEEITTGHGNKASRTIKITSAKPPGLSIDEGVGTQSSLPKTAQGPKLVIHLGGRNKNTAAPPKSEASSLRKGQDLASLNGEPEDDYESVSPKKTHSLLGKRRTEDIRSGMPVGKRSRYSTMKLAEDRPAGSGDLIADKSNTVSVSQAPENDRKPCLKFKIPKNSSNGSQSMPINSKIENQNLMPLPGKDEITYTRGQRSKRRRPGLGDEETSQRGEDKDETIKDFTDANWILQKLGKDATGKRVEVHHTSDNSWHRGTVIEVLEGTSMVSIALDEGMAKKFELGKQGIRFASQKR